MEQNGPLKNHEKIIGRSTQYPILPPTVPCRHCYIQTLTPLYSREVEMDRAGSDARSRAAGQTDGRTVRATVSELSAKLVRDRFFPLSILIY